MHLVMLRSVGFGRNLGDLGIPGNPQQPSGRLAKGTRSQTH